MKLRFPVQMLIIDRSPAEAAALVASLRRASYVVHPSLARDLATVKEVLSKTRLDMVLIGHNLKEGPVEAVIKLIEDEGSDAPVIVLDEYDHDAAGLAARDAALRAGVIDIVPRDEPMMLEHTVTRELAALENRRRVARYKRNLDAEEQSLNWLVNHSSERLAITRGDDIIAVNNGFLDLFGIEDVDLPWRDGLLDCVASGEREELRAFIESTDAAGSRPVQVEIQGTHSNDGDFELLLDIAPASFHGEAGRRVIARAAAEPLALPKDPVAIRPTGEAAPEASEQAEPDQVRKEQAGPQLAVVASNDVVDAVSEVASDVSGVVDRPQFLNLVSTACKSLEQRDDRVGIVYIDLDDFAALKKEVGIVGIDELVEKVIERLEQLAPEGSVISRVSDDDFAVLVSAGEWEAVEEIYNSIEAGICGVVLEVAERAVLVSAGAGLTGLLSDDTDAESVLERAFKASQNELHSVVGVRAEEEEDEGVDEDASFQELADDLASAMHDGRLSLVYQPIVSLRGVPIELYEVFMRFRNKQGMMVPPREFIDAAAFAGMGSDLDLWLVEQVIVALGEQHAQGRRTRLLVKVSDQALGDVRVPLTVARGLRKYKIPADRMIIEVGERAAANQVKATRTMMHALRGVNCATALEHFGVTRKPFRLLEHIPVDYITVDTAIVNQVKQDPEAFERVKRIGTRARSLGKFSCAEYVEDAASVGLLYDAGIDFVQGFYIQPPLPALDFEFSMMVG